MLHGAQLWVALPDAAARAGAVVRPPPRAARAARAAARRRRCCSASWPAPARRAGAHARWSAWTSRSRAGRMPCSRSSPTSSTPCSRSPVRRTSTAAELPAGSLCYLGTGRSTLRLRAETPSRLLLLGGIPFTEKIVMWWNFVARTGEEIAEARERWQAELAGEPTPTAAAGTGSFRPGPFGAVPGYEGPALAAPPLPADAAAPARPHPVSGEPAISGVHRSVNGDRRLPPLAALDSTLPACTWIRHAHRTRRADTSWRGTGAAGQTDHHNGDRPRRCGRLHELERSTVTRGRRGRRSSSTAEVCSEHTRRDLRPLVADCGVSARRVGDIRRARGPSVAGVDGAAGSPGPAAHGMHVVRAGRQCGRARGRAPGVADAAVRGHRGAEPRRGRRAVLPRARRSGCGAGARARTATSSWARTSCAPCSSARPAVRWPAACRSCSARRGTRRWSRSGSRATARRSPGCTRSADPHVA